MKFFKIYIFSMMLLLAGCAQLGLQKADSFDQKMAYSYSAVAAVRTSAADALAAGTLKLGDAQKVLTDTDQIRSLLDQARAANAISNFSTASNSLLSASLILTQLQQYLIAKGAK